jgi:hypothetical protein
MELFADSTPVQGATLLGRQSLRTSLWTVCQMQRMLCVHELGVCHFMAHEQKFVKLIATEKSWTLNPEWFCDLVRHMVWHSRVRQTTDSAIINLKSWPSCFKKHHVMYILNILLVVFNVEMLLKVILGYALAVVSHLNCNVKWGSHFFTTKDYPPLCSTTFITTSS